MFKKVYIEITNHCNLCCPFCIHNDRPKEFMSLQSFNLILNKLKHHTKYLYFHILGEPTIHPEINEFINLANREGFYVNITTNGTNLKKIVNNRHIRQINISLHSNNSLKYLENVYEACSKLQNYTYINYRLWQKIDPMTLNFLESKYGVTITGSTKLAPNVFLDIEKSFIWPNLDNQIFNEEGTCYGLKDHIGILVDGTIVPCCLDTKGTINLGNIFEDNIDDILKKERPQKMLHGFQNKKYVEDLCKHCGFSKERR